MAAVGMTAEGEGDFVFGTFGKDFRVVSEGDDGEIGREVFEGEGEIGATGAGVVEADDRDLVGVAGDGDRLVSKEDGAACFDLVEELLAVSEVVVVAGGNDYAVGGMKG